MSARMDDLKFLAEGVREACIAAAIEAYEDGGIRGLCAEGRFEYAVSAIRQIDVDAAINRMSKRCGNHRGTADVVSNSGIVDE